MAIPCALLTQDYTLGCDTGSGGTKEVYFIEQDNVLSVAESSGTVTAITKATGAIFRKYSLVPETANFEETISGNIQNGTLFYDQKGAIILNKQQVAVRNELLLLAQIRVIALIKDNNNTYRLYGAQNGMKLLTGSATTGVAFGDRNGYSLEFTGKENKLAPFVADSVIATLQTPGA